jgi:predicted RNA-binding Zn ribbon-like protein
LRALIAKSVQSEGHEVPAGQARDDETALADLARLAAQLPLVVDVAGEVPRLIPATGRSFDDALARILAAVAGAVADGTWTRMKVCRQPDCRWAYFDESRNRSRTWCSMETCGNRAKARMFRERRR